MRCSQVIVVLTGVLLATSARAVDVTTLGQVVPKGKTGVLQVDLTCAPQGVGVQLEKGATLDLNGHVLDGCSVGAANTPANKPHRMTVHGPGEIRNASYGIYLAAGTLRVSDLEIHDTTFAGIIGSGGFGDGPSTVRLTDVTITGSGNAAIQATKVVARRVTASGNGSQLGSPAIIGWSGVNGRDLDVGGNTGGVFAAAGQVKIMSSQINQNGAIGVQGFKVSISNSTVTQNTAGPDTADVVSSLLPKLKETICGTSLKADATGTWGVCQDD